MNTKTVVVVALAVATIWIAACGSSSPKASSNASSTAPSNQNIAADNAAAEAAALKLSDFPAGWTSEPQSNTTDNSSINTQVAKCLGVNEKDLSKPPAAFDSPNFSDASSNTASSRVGYRPSAKGQTAAFDLYARPKTPDCLNKAVAAAIDYGIKHPSNPASTVPAGLTFGQSTVAQMSFPPLGDKSIAYQVKIPVNIKSLTVNVYLDSVVAIKGRADVSMTFEGTGNPFPTDQAQHYTQLVVGRLTNT